MSPLGKLLYGLLSKQVPINARGAGHPPGGSFLNWKRK